MAETFTMSEVDISVVVGSTTTVKGFAKNFRAVSRNQYYVHQRLTEKAERKEKIRESYEITWDEAFFDTSVDGLQLNDTEFSVVVDYDNGDKHYRRTYGECKLETHDDHDGENVMETSVTITCRTKTAGEIT